MLVCHFQWTYTIKYYIYNIFLNIDFKVCAFSYEYNDVT